MLLWWHLLCCYGNSWCCYGDYLIIVFSLLHSVMGCKYSLHLLFLSCLMLYFSIQICPLLFLIECTLLHLSYICMCSSVVNHLFICSKHVYFSATSVLGSHSNYFLSWDELSVNCWCLNYPYLLMVIEEFTCSW